MGGLSTTETDRGRQQSVITKCPTGVEQGEASRSEAAIAVGSCMTVYDRATHAFIREVPKSAVSSLTSGLTKNADGSIEVYFGPNAPSRKEANWVSTKSGGNFEVMFRLYGPEKPLFDKSWKLPGIERMDFGAGGRALQ